MYERRYGVKYDEKLSTKEIAKRIRADLKAAVKAGILPNVKFSVTSSRGSGRAVDVRIMSLPEGMVIHNELRLIDEVQRAGVTPGIPWASAKARALLDNVEAIRQAYNYDGSHLETDFFDVNYYGGTDFDPELSSAQYAQRLSEIREKIAAGWTYSELRERWVAPSADDGDTAPLALVLPFPRLPNGDVDEDAVVAQAPEPPTVH